MTEQRLKKRVGRRKGQRNKLTVIREKLYAHSMTYVLLKGHRGCGPARQRLRSCIREMWKHHPREMTVIMLETLGL